MRRITVLLTCSLLTIAMIGDAGAASQAQVGPTLNVWSGWGSPGLVVDEFLPATLTVAEGTTITWTQESLRDHTVTFLAGNRLPPQNIPQPEDPALPQMRNPLAEYPTPPLGPWDGNSFINSGRMQVGESFSVTFGRTGSYPYVCIPHADMTGTVNVVRPGSAGITTQPQVDDYVASQDALFDRQLTGILAARSDPGRVDNRDGSATWFVRNGTDQRFEEDFMRGRLTLRRYLPGALTVRQGDTVVWYADTRVGVHTVTFPIQDEPAPIARQSRNADGSSLSADQLTASGVYRGDSASLDWPRIIDNPPFNFVSRPSPVYDPTKFFNSGAMGDGTPSGRAWSLTFDTPGTFTYFCIPHYSIGQFGAITVVP